MKLQIFIFIVGIAAVASCGPSYRVTDQSTVSSDTVSVPSAIRSSFATQYPTAANVTWSSYDAANVPIDWDLNGWPALDQGDYVAIFNMDNDKYYAWFDSDGTWIGTAYAIGDYKSLPSAINAMITDKFPGYTISSVNREMQKDGLAYEIQLKNGDSKTKVLVDESGNIIKQKLVVKQ